jgi:hypothetical protein
MGLADNILGGLSGLLSSPFLSKEGTQMPTEYNPKEQAKHLDAVRQNEEHRLLQEALRQQQSQATQSGLAAAASNILSQPLTGTGTFGGQSTTTTGTGWSHTSQPFQYTSAQDPEQWLKEPEPKKKYKNEIDKTIAEEVRRIKNL